MNELATTLIALFVLHSAWSHAAPPFPEFIDPNPNPGNLFGQTVVPLSTGNVVITSPGDDAGGTNAGAVYLFNGATGALISTLTGSQANDQVGSNGVTALSNGNYVIASWIWDNASAVDAGAVTWGSGTSGVSGAINSSNSLVGTKNKDNYGRSVTALSNGNYVVSSPGWDNASAVDAGAVTWGSGTSGVSGAINSGNSLVGTTVDDRVGSVTALSNGNYVVIIPSWDNASAWNAGAVTWGSGTSGVKGAVTASNSLVGSTVDDLVGYNGVTALSNGNYVVLSARWDNAGVYNAGAATWGSGSSGVSGVVSSSNSLVGTTVGDSVGYNGVAALSNGNYVVRSQSWDNAGVVNAGAATWGSGSSGVSGVVSSGNSLVGTMADDEVGNGGVTALSNGNYVVNSPYWNNGAIADVGAVTWGSGSSGVSGAVSSSNSLVGTTASDYVGSYGVTALSNGNYVVRSAFWDNASVVNAGAVTWGSGSSGVSGAVTSSNSLVGTQIDDQLRVNGWGTNGVTALSNGNYVVNNPYWNNGAIADAGAVTWGSGTSGVIGVVNSSNSLIGTMDNDKVGYAGVTALSNGNYVVNSPFWNSANTPDGIAAAGAVTWGSGSSGVSGTVSSNNSLVGTKANDQVGSTGFYPGVTALNNGNYVVNNPYWNNASVVNAGAVTWGSGSSGVSGAVSSSNSLVGTTAGDYVGGNVTALSNGNYVVVSAGWSSASLQYAGAVTWGSGSSGVSGAVSSSNSLVGVTSDGWSALVVEYNVNDTFFVSNPREGSGKVRHGAQVGGFLPAKAQSLVFTSPLKLYLTESPFTLGASTSSGLPIVYTVISGPATVSGNVLTLTGTGTVKVRASQPGNVDFLAATPVDRTITVAANPTTLTLTNLSQTYTGTRRPITVLGATGAVDVTYKVGLNYVPEAPINVGSYPVKAVAGSVTKTGSLIINKAPLFVQPDDQRKLTGQANPVFGFSYSGFLDDDNVATSVSKAPVIATTATATSAGGLYPITASGGTSANYLFVYLKGTMKVETFAGSYEALLVVAGTSHPAAKLELTVAASSKTFTAKLTTPTEAAAVGLNGTLTTYPLYKTATGTATVAKGANTYLVTVTLPLTGDFTAVAERNGFPLGTATNGRKLLTLVKGQTLSYIGTHSALLAPAAAATGVPAGAGWAVATIDAKGLLKLTGKLADGTGLTASLAADVSSHPGYRLFLQPYLPARTGAFIAGAFTLKPHPDVAGRRIVAFEDAADLTWVKARRDLDTSYRAGFGPVETRFTLDPWLPPAAAKVGVPAITLTQRLGLTANQFTAQHSTISSASFDDLAKTLGLNATTNIVSVTAPLANLTKWKVTVTPATGAFVGSFELTDSGKKRLVPFAGIMRQPSSTDTSGLIGDGNFLLPSLLSAPNNEILSGEIGFER